MIDNKLTVTPSEAAQLLGLSKPVIYELCHRPDFPVVRVGRVIRIPRSGLESWLEKNSYMGGN